MAEPMATRSWRSRCQASAHGLRPSIREAGREPTIVLARRRPLNPFSNRHRRPVTGGHFTNGPFTGRLLPSRARVLSSLSPGLASDKGKWQAT